MPMCCAVGCSSRFKDGKRLFRVPSGKRDVARREEWLRRINRKNFTPSGQTRLCEDHFTPDAFERHRADGKRKLKPNAVPSVFAPFKPRTHARRPPRQKSIRCDANVQPGNSAMGNEAASAMVEGDANVPPQNSAMSDEAALAMAEGDEYILPGSLTTSDKQVCATTRVCFIHEERIRELERKLQNAEGRVRKLEKEKEILLNELRMLLAAGQVF
ncbi:peroxynitrite isomerase THAP4 [Ixodes scapularis]|uniref:peroxynitrite isomerase THAP4 n=1 Tax=Ixodes scapularis TaxID=6945 RepID=UPI001A9DA4BB|nr:peroxynitrite isomerase THAP4 [Ixodes scapularis]